MNRGLALLIILSMLLGTAALPGRPTLPERKYIIMTTSESQLSPEVMQAIARAGGGVLKTIPQGGFALASSRNPAFTDELSSAPGIESVIPNFKTEPAGASRYSGIIPYREAAGRDLTELQWGNLAVGSTIANAAGLRGQGVRVAIIDFGLDRYHPDIAPNLNAELSRSFLEGRDWGIDNDTDDFFGHASMIAGIIAAPDDGFGLTGIAPEAEIVALRACEAFWCDAFAFFAAMYYAVDIQADLVNLSAVAGLSRRAYWDDMGTPDDPSDDVHITANQTEELVGMFRRAVLYLNNHNVTLIHAAGNDGTNCDEDKDVIILPGAFQSVASISGTAPNGYGEDRTVDLQTYVSWSNYGQSCVDFAAPGGGNDAYLRWEDPEHTFCTVAGIYRMCSIFDHVIGPVTGGWAFGSGTSFSTPFAVGVAALVIGQHGGPMSPQQVLSILRDNAIDLGKPGVDDFYGWGHIYAGNLAP